MTARWHSLGRSTSTRPPEGQRAWPLRSRTSRAPGPRNEYFRVRVEFILWTDDVCLPRMQNHRVLAVAARSGQQSGHGTHVTPASLPGLAEGSGRGAPVVLSRIAEHRSPPSRVSSIGAAGFEPGTSCSQTSPAGCDSRRETVQVQLGLHDLPFLPLGRVWVCGAEKAGKSGQMAGTSRHFRDPTLVTSVKPRTSRSTTRIREGAGLARRRGHSKTGRMDAAQVVVGLAMTRDGFPPCVAGCSPGIRWT